MNEFGVRIYFVGQIGNQLFHYCLGKILAEKYELAFDPPAVFIDKKGSPVKWSGEPLFVMQPTKGRRFPEQQGFQFGAYYWYDFDSLPRDRPLHVCYGHWCRYELFKSYKERIRNDWLKIPAHRFIETDPEAVYIHVRRTDFVVPDDPEGQGSATTIEEFGKCLAHFPDAQRLVIVTDDGADPFHAGFANFGLPFVIQSEEWDRDFLTLASCRNLLMSQSTFSWWAGFLGKAEKIVCPVSPGSHWLRGTGAPKEDFLNLFVDDEPGRWLFIP